jgi:pimeloyl-ACP methyl ester carboxylesterase
MTTPVVPALTPDPATMQLRDGRQLAWYEFGDPYGVPCVYMPGTPESGLAGGCYDRAAAEGGVRWIAVDKPGYGRSDFAPGRTLRDWPDDVAQLADHLGLSRFAAVGESGGGPHALALGFALADRLTTVVLLAAMGPGHERWVRKGMRPSNIMFFWLSRLVPVTLRLPLGVMRRATRSPRLAARLEASGPPADRRATADPEYRTRLLAVPDAFRQGTRAAAQELALFARPWGFELADVATPAHLWHGTDDVNVPLSVAQAVGRALPETHEHIVAGAAHTVGFERRRDVMQAIVEAGERA